MPSFGETDLLVGNRVAGVVRVLGIHPGQAVYPRLSLQLGISLYDLTPSAIPPTEALQNYEMRELVGEVSLAEAGKSLGSLRWVGSRGNVRSYSHPIERHVEVVCDLDWPRVEAIEEHRAGKEAIFWLSIWPTIVGAAGSMESTVRPFQVHIPRERWLDYLEQLSGIKRTLIEVVFPSGASPEMAAPSKHLADARKRLDRGDFDEAVACCRRALESLLAVLSLPKEDGALEARLTASTDAKRAKVYTGIVSRIKELGNFTVHRRDASPLYVRSEAQFAVATTAHLVALLASLAVREDG